VKSTIKCPHCPRTFEGEGNKGYVQGRVKANLANHIKSAHPEHYKPSKAAMKRKEQSNVTALPLEVITDVNPVRKRPYTRKPKSVNPSATVCFCPQCGCNIRAVSVAMGL